MSFTAQEVMASIAVRAHKDISTAGSDDDLDVKEWVKQAIRHIQKADDWRCQKINFSLTTATTPALTAGTYAYALPTLIPRYRKLLGNSVRYGGHGLDWKENSEDIDDALGPQWKDGSKSGSPGCVTVVGNDLWVAPNPSDAFITANGATGISGYCYTGEDVASTTAGGDAADWEDVALRFPDDFYMEVVDVAMIFALQTEDDSDFQTLLNQWERIGLTRLRGYDEVPLTDEQVPLPIWARGAR
jgi:hypothetical protein